MSVKKPKNSDRGRSRQRRLATIVRQILELPETGTVTHAIEQLCGRLDQIDAQELPVRHRRIWRDAEYRRGFAIGLILARGAE